MSVGEAYRKKCILSLILFFFAGGILFMGGSSRSKRKVGKLEKLCKSYVNLFFLSQFASFASSFFPFLGNLSSLPPPPHILPMPQLCPPFPQTLLIGLRKKECLTCDVTRASITKVHSFTSENMFGESKGGVLLLQYTQHLSRQLNLILVISPLGTMQCMFN